MNSSLAFKVAVPTVAVPSVAGASYLAFFKQDEIKDSLKALIEKEGKRIVLEDYSNSHDNIWDEIAKEYKTSSITVEGVSKTNPDKAQVKEYCKNTSSLTDEKLLDTYRTLCSRGKLIDQINEDLKSEKKAWLTSTNKADWTANKTAYGSNGGANLLIPQTGQGSTTISKEQISEEKLMEWCSSVSFRPFVNKTHTDYTVSKHNCTKSNA
ncbi:hypothetical protein MHF_1444 [Mycoplasma haemofelis Ohio2]|uniref:Uncharacterized protein n=1 Tax=Mycoplasma haemofelis (strain Ohio2) TaxID=859194 RepID=F6FGW9_MYCHI|nr:hypothetical protein MHF_1444 [Mycoplasma haemofelis Ohio2]